MADVSPEEPDFLSRPRLPLGTLTLLFGAGGEGKTYLACAVMASLSRGVGLWGALDTGLRTTCIYFTAEDSLGMLRRRLDLLGADAEYIHGYGEPFGFEEEGFAFVEAEIREHEAEFVVVDPLVAFLGRDLDMYRPNETRAVLAPLRQVAERTKSAVVLVTHTTKSAASRAINRALGSADFGNAARSALLVGADPDDHRRKALCHVKCNFAPLADPVGFEIAEDGRFTWTSTDLTPARILGSESSDEERSAGGAAEELLREMCAREVRAAKVIAQAEAEGISKRTLQRVAARVCVRRREGVGTSRQAVYWRLREDDVPARSGRAGHMSDMATTGASGQNGKPCYACRQSRWWIDTTGRRVCSTCHPPPQEAVP